MRCFPTPADWKNTDWVRLYSNMYESLKANSHRKVIMTAQGHRIEYEEMKAVYSKPVMDYIDCALALHYGFTEEELEFIINYDIKYRMGGTDAEKG